MSLPNLVIVFSPTLQLSAPILHALYNNSQRLFGDVELAKWVDVMMSPCGHSSGTSSLWEEDSLSREDSVPFP